ncbi:hypothetical protein B0H11DRAFT_2399945 [Mycena galericulata]|nr:hypothetical protein B0H11DRAFT_2399945 [Mycena galericulata]
MSLPTFTSTTTAEEVATVFADQIRGKNGTSMNGIGFEAARVIAKYASLLIITGYNSERWRPVELLKVIAEHSVGRLKLSEEAIKKELPSANIRLLTLDLASLAGVRKAAAEVYIYEEPIHVLIHNAAAAAGPYKLSADGFELHMATDQVGPFLLTKLLVPKLLAATTPGYTPRVVFVSSLAHTWAPPMDFANLVHPDPKSFSTHDAYAAAKLANVLTAIELSRRSKGKIDAYSLHPGVIFTNILQKEESKTYFQEAGILTAEGLPNPDKLEWKSIPEGAATTVAAAFDPRLDAKPGAYLSDGMEANEIASHRTEENAAKLWTATEELIGEKWEF